MHALLVALLVAAAPAKKEAPLRQVDRTKAVGAPVLDDKTKEGIYVWLEDGWINVAAVSRSRGKQRMKVSFRSSKKIEKSEGELAKQGQGNALVLTAAVGELAVKGRFKTEGDVTVSTSHALYVGPLSRKAAATVTIGRY